MLPTLPEEATPAERAILFAYSTGIHDPIEISRLLRPNSKSVVYRVLRDYREVLPSLRSPVARFIGNGLVSNIP